MKNILKISNILVSKTSSILESDIRNFLGSNYKELNDLKLEFKENDVLFALETICYSYNKDGTVFITGKTRQLKKNLVINTSNLSFVLNFLRIPQLNIFSIEEVTETEIIIVKGLTSINYIRLNKNDFLEYSSNPKERILDYNQNSLYIFRNGKYNDVKSLLRQINNCHCNIGMAVGSDYNHLSEIEFRLSCYLIAISHQYRNTNKDLVKIKPDKLYKN